MPITVKNSDGSVTIVSLKKTAAVSAKPVVKPPPVPPTKAVKVVMSIDSKGAASAVIARKDTLECDVLKVLYDKKAALTKKEIAKALSGKYEQVELKMLGSILYTMMNKSGGEYVERSDATVKRGIEWALSEHGLEFMSSVARCMPASMPSIPPPADDCVCCECGSGQEDEDWAGWKNSNGDLYCDDCKQYDVEYEDEDDTE